MEISSVGKNLVTIKGVNDNRYICMNRENGQMFARVSCYIIFQIAMAHILDDIP